MMTAEPCQSTENPWSVAGDQVRFPLFGRLLWWERPTPPVTEVKPITDGRPFIGLQTDHIETVPEASVQLLRGLGPQILVGSENNDWLTEAR